TPDGCSASAFCSAVRSSTLLPRSSGPVSRTSATGRDDSTTQASWLIAVLSLLLPWPTVLGPRRAARAQGEPAVPAAALHPSALTSLGRCADAQPTPAWDFRRAGSSRRARPWDTLGEYRQGWGAGGRDAWLHRGQGRVAQAAAADRGPGPRP